MIENPNTSGQGFDPDHALNPYHTIILSFGYVYSHSTPVTYSSTRTIHHTYAVGEHKVSAWMIRNTTYWGTTVSPASGRQTQGRDAATLQAHLKRKAGRYPELRAARIAAQQTGGSKP